MLSLNTVMINSEEPGKLKEFYTKILGEPGWSGGEFTGWKAGPAYLMVGPHSDVKGVNDMPGRILFNFETSDVRAEFDRLVGLGVTAVQEPYQPGEAGGEMWLATLADPDGNYFQLASPMPESG